MRAILACAALVIGCRHGGAPASSAAVAHGGITILENGVGVYELDAAAGTTRLMPDFGRLYSSSAQQRGPFVTFSTIEPLSVIDLRDLAHGKTVSDEISESISHAWAISAVPAPTSATAVSVADDVIHVQDLPSRSTPGSHHAFPSPAPEVAALAVSPDGTTLALVGGPRAEQDRPQDLFTIRTRDGVSERWTHEGTVADAAFVDDATVVFLRGNGAFNLLDLRTRETRRVAPPDGWSPELLDDYVGWTRGTLFDHDTAGTAPLLPIRTEDGRRALFDPRSGGRIELGYNYKLVAVAPDGSSAVVTTPCSVPGGLERRWQTRAAEVLRPSPGDDVCRAPRNDGDQPAGGPVRVSAVFSADSRLLIFAEPIESRWRVQVVDDSGHVRTVFESHAPTAVFRWR